MPHPTVSCRPICRPISPRQDGCAPWCSSGFRRRGHWRHGWPHCGRNYAPRSRPGSREKDPQAAKFQAVLLMLRTPGLRPAMRDQVRPGDRRQPDRQLPGQLVGSEQPGAVSRKGRRPSFRARARSGPKGVAAVAGGGVACAGLLCGETLDVGADASGRSEGPRGPASRRANHPIYQRRAHHNVPEAGIYAPPCPISEVQVGGHDALLVLNRLAGRSAPDAPQCGKKERIVGGVHERRCPGRSGGMAHPAEGGARGADQDHMAPGVAIFGEVQQAERQGGQQDSRERLPDCAPAAVAGNRGRPTPPPAGRALPRRSRSGSSTGRSAIRSSADCCRWACG